MNKQKQQNVLNYIKERTGITVSKMLSSFIFEPRKLDSLNNVALKEIVIEYAPIYDKFKSMIDGPPEMSPIAIFEIFLTCRIANKPELKSILYKNEQ